MDTAQALLIAVVIILTVMLVAIGFQVFYILRAIRETLEKANKVLDDAGHITESVKNPINSLSALLLGLRGSTSVVGMLKRIGEKKRGKEHE